MNQYALLRTARTRMTALLALWAAMVALGGASQHGAQQDDWQKVDGALTALGIRGGSRVDDVGAGVGFFTVRFARRVGEQGRVYPVDISKRALERLRAAVEDERLGNVEPILGVQDNPRLPSGLGTSNAGLPSSRSAPPSNSFILRDVRAFDGETVAARIEEGSDFIQITIYSGEVFKTDVPTLNHEQLVRIVAAVYAWHPSPGPPSGTARGADPGSY